MRRTRAPPETVLVALAAGRRSVSPTSGQRYQQRLRPRGRGASAEAWRRSLEVRALDAEAGRLYSPVSMFGWTSLFRLCYTMFRGLLHHHADIMILYLR